MYFSENIQGLFTDLLERKRKEREEDNFPPLFHSPKGHSSQKPRSQSSSGWVSGNQALGLHCFFPRCISRKRLEVQEKPELKLEIGRNFCHDHHHLSLLCYNTSPFLWLLLYDCALFSNFFLES